MEEEYDEQDLVNFVNDESNNNNNNIIVIDQNLKIATMSFINALLNRGYGEVLAGNILLQLLFCF